MNRLKKPVSIIIAAMMALTMIPLSTEIKGYKKGKTVKFKVATFGNGDKVDNITALSPYKTISITIK